MPAEMRLRRHGYVFGLAALLAAAAALRLVLVFRGGQHFWPDENRYDAALAAWTLWGQGQWRAGALQILQAGDHLGFKALMLGPAWIQHHWPAEFRIPSAIVSLFSVANIVWVWRIARRLGAAPRESFWAAAAMTASASMAYWARHLMPYDIAMFWALACLYTGLGRQTSWLRSLGIGLLGFAAFVTYLGYWATVVCALAAHVLSAWPERTAMAKRAVAAFVGLAGGFALLVGVSRALGGAILGSLQTFTSNVTQGDFGEGHLVILDYLWSAERFTVLFWLAAFAALVVLARRTDEATRRRGLLYATFVLALFAILVTGCNVLHKFVVYGRLARQVVPFCSLLVGWAAVRVFPGSDQPGEPAPWSWTQRLALGALLLSGAFGVVQPLRQQYPLTFQVRAERAMARYRQTHATEEAKAPRNFRVSYAYFIWPYPTEPPIPPGSELLLRALHPIQWRPYSFEGYNRDQRKVVESTDVSMKLIALPN